MKTPTRQMGCISKITKRLLAAFDAFKSWKSYKSEKAASPFTTNALSISKCLKSVFPFVSSKSYTKKQIISSL